MRRILLLVGAVALVATSAAVADAVYRDPVGDARRGADIRSVAVSERGGMVEVVVRLASRLPDAHLVQVYVDSDRTAKTGAQHRYRLEPPAGTDFSMWGSNRAGNAVWVDHDHKAATEDPLEIVPAALWHKRVTPFGVTFTFARELLANPPEGFGQLQADRKIRYTVRSFQLMGVIHDRSPDSGWHTFTLRRGT